MFIPDKKQSKNMSTMPFSIILKLWAHYAYIKEGIFLEGKVNHYFKII